MDYERGANYQIIALLQKIANSMESGQPAEPIHVTQEYITEQAVIQEKRLDAIKYMLAVALPSTPMVTEPLVVGTTAVILYENLSEPLLRISVANDDIAQPMWIGPQQSVSHLTGARIPGTDWRDFVMPIGSKLWGVTDVGFISVRLSLGYNIKAIMDASFPGV